nr:reverse transcriptase domain-containing protein [Tanacetum cinerariifolium]
MEEMMITTTAFIRGEVAAASKKKGHTSWKTQDQLKRQTSEKKSDFQGKLSRLIKEIKHGRDQSKMGKKEIPAKDKPTAIYMIKSWQRMTRQKVTQSFKRVKEITFPPLTASSGVEGPLVIEAEMGRHMIHRIHMIHRMYVDGGSSMEILYEHCFNRLQPEIKSQMVLATTSLTGFSGETIWPLGQLRLLVTIEDVDHSTRAWMNFMIVRSLSPYNGIIGRPIIREIQAVPSTAHGILKFPVEGGIVTICSTILIPVECTSMITSSAVSKEEGTRPENFKVALHPDFPDQEVAIGGTLSMEGRTELCSILKKNLDIFAWKPSDMTGVPRSVAEHRLNIREGYSPVRQKKKGQAPKHAKAIQVELADVRRFHEFEQGMSAGLLPLREIDWKVESLCGYPFKCFLDAYKGYHRIQLAEPDEEKTTFHTGQWVYCYTKMSFGLKNVGATYQRLVDKAFHNQIVQNIEVYVDDLTAEAEQAFKQLKQHLSELPLLVAPKPKEELLVYLSATYGAIRPETKLYSNGKASSVTSLRSQETSESVMLEEHNITYRPRTIVKGQILADFLTEMPDENSPAAPVAKTQQEPWTLFTDGSSCVDGSGAGLILTSPMGIEFTYTLRFQFAASNNEAEYEALIAGLRIAAQMGVQNVHVGVDSKLIANQVLGTYVAKEENMIKYLDKVKSLVSGFTNFSISHVPRSKNKKADALSKIASISFAHLSKQVLVEILKEKSIKEKEVTTVVEEDGPTWMTPIMEYFKEATLPNDRKEARNLRIKARQYDILEGILYRRSFLTSWLTCVGPLKAEYVIKEIHEGSCSMHAGPRLVVAKAIRLGYYWPTMHGDARDMIRKCNDCQIHRPVTRNPQQPLTPITAPWPFYKWGIDIAGPFSKGPVQRTRRKSRPKFGGRNKGPPGRGEKNWVEELPHVLWAHRTMIKSSYGDTRFSLTYGTKAVILVEIGMPTYRTATVDVVYNDEELRLNLDLLEERRECVAIREAKAKMKKTKYYNARVRSVTFRPGDFVYHSNDASHAVAGGKLGPKWEGLYEVTKALGDGAYKLQSTDGIVLPRTWNITNLKRCYL